MTKRQILLLIAAFIALTFGSFIWYIVTWDADMRTVRSHVTFALLENTPAGGSDINRVTLT